MNIDTLAFLAPLLGVLIFFSLERCTLNEKSIVKNRIRTILGVQAISLFTSLLLSVVFLVPLVFLVAPLQIFSFTNLDVPRYVSFALSFLFLDLVNYLQHRLHHKVPLLWRLHRLHHSDRNMDSFTALLHHPLEVCSGFLFTVTVAVIFDVPVLVMVVYAIVSGLHAPFTHYRKLLPETIEKYFKYILITPNFHKVHHSINMKEGNSNFGILFVFWDFMFKTSYCKNENELNNMKLGIENKQYSATINVINYLKNPIIKAK